MQTIAKLRELAQRTGRWLGLGQAAAEHATAVIGDRFDDMTWRETRERAGALGNLGRDLGETFDHVGDLLRDVFVGAYKAAPELRPAGELLASRRVNGQIMSALLNAPEFAELREYSVGDEYAAAMAVLAQAGTLREMLGRAKDAQKAAEDVEQAREQAAERGDVAAAALEAAAQGADEDGSVDDEVAAAAEAALAAAAEADQGVASAEQDLERGLAAAAAAARAAARRGLKEAVDQAREEAELMAAWGVGDGRLRAMDFDERARLAQRLRRGRLGRYADLIGRFRQMAVGQRTRRIEGVSGELVGVTLGADLGRLVPSELAGLALPALRADFVARLAEGRLLQFAVRGEVEAGQGAIVACIDCSESMERVQQTGSGGPVTREAWAKACGLALLEQAQAARRDFVGILFSSARQVKVFRFPGSERPPLDVLLEFGEHFFGGGTDFKAPLTVAADVLELEFTGDGKQRGDIVLITDGLCEVGAQWLATWREARARLEFRVYGITIGRASASGRTPAVLDSLCDDVRSIADLADPGAARELFHLI